MIPNTGQKPIDVDVLRQQTSQDTALQAELLAIFIEQATLVGDVLAMGADPAVALLHVHRLNGSARAIGALSLAAEAEQLELELEHHLDDDRVEPGVAKAVQGAIAEACGYAAWLQVQLR